MLIPKALGRGLVGRRVHYPRRYAFLKLGLAFLRTLGQRQRKPYMEPPPCPFQFIALLRVVEPLSLGSSATTAMTRSKGPHAKEPVDEDEGWQSNGVLMSGLP